MVKNRQLDPAHKMHPNQEAICAVSGHNKPTSSEERNGKSRFTHSEDGRNAMYRVCHFIFDLEKDPRPHPIFPPFTIFLFVPVVFWTRYALITHPDGLAIRDPKEHWGAVEVANSYLNAFGPHHSKSILGHKHVPETGVRADEMSSWIVIGMYTLFFKSTKYFGCQATPYEMARIFHSLVAAGLPFTVYKFTRGMFRQCRDVALLAAILTAFSKHLMLTALHPFTESLLSPFIFLAMAMITSIQNNVSKDQPRTNDVAQDQERCNDARKEQGRWNDDDLTRQSRSGDVCKDQERLSLISKDQDRSGYASKSQPRTFRKTNFWSNICSSIASFILGGAVSIQPESIATIGPMLLFLSPPTTPHRMKTTWLATGGLLGIASGALLDHIGYVVLGPQDLRIAASRQTCIRIDHSTTFEHYFGMFWGGSWLHGVLVLTALAFSCLNWTCTWNRSSRLTGWIANQQIWHLGVTTSLTITSLTTLFIISCQGCAKLHRIHDCLVLILVAGASGLDFSYHTIYTNLKSRRVSSLALDTVELVLYCKLALYVWSSWSRMPLDEDNSLRDIVEEGHLASASYNGCLKFVGQQADSMGVVLEFPLIMTGGWALLGKDIPLISKTDSGWVEHRLTEAHRLEEHILPRRFNYIIVGENRKFAIPGFYEVHHSAGVRTFRFYDSRYRAAVFEDGVRIPKDKTQDARLLEAKGGLWHYLGDYAKAKEMLMLARHLDSDKFESWKSLMETLYFLGEFDQIESQLKYCRSQPEVCGISSDT